MINDLIVVPFFKKNNESKIRCGIKWRLLCKTFFSPSSFFHCSLKDGVLTADSKKYHYSTSSPGFILFIFIFGPSLFILSLVKTLNVWYRAVKMRAIFVRYSLSNADIVFKVVHILSTPSVCAAFLCWYFKANFEFNIFFLACVVCLEEFISYWLLEERQSV